MTESPVTASRESGFSSIKGGQTALRKAGDDGRSGRPVWVELSIVVVVTLLITLPFIFKPIHMDDAGFIELARERRDNPMEMVLSDYTFFGQENESFLDTHPPLVSSYIAFLINVSGAESETFLHLGFLIFPLMAAISMYYLARFFTRHALVAALMLIVTPGVMVMSHGLMSDVPGLSLWLTGVTLYLYGLKQKSLVLMTICGLVITTGVFTSYQVLSVIPLLFAYALIRKELSLLAFIPFALPLSAFASYCVWHFSMLGIFPRFSYGVGEPLAWYSVIQKGASVFAAIGGTVVFFAVLMRVLLARKWDFTVYLVFLVPMWVAIMVQFASVQFSAWAAILSILLMPLGIMLLYRIFAEAWEGLEQERRDRQAMNALLFLWLAGVLFYVIILLPYSSVRYLLPALPPLILLFIRLVEGRFAGSRNIQNLLIGGVMATAGLGLLVAEADYELAVANRDFAGNEGAAYGRQVAADDHRLWFIGEFGFRYYMEQQGFTELPKDRPEVLRDGDLIVQSPLADPRPFSDEMAERVELVETVGYSGMTPFRSISFKSKAGFYGHFWGILPFSLDFGNIEEYMVYRVVPEHEIDHE
ncbi:MAG: glycosyltransferase family 39 protein [Thermoleophilia bacterium]|jgi:hypothetical protein